MIPKIIEFVKANQRELLLLLAVFLATLFSFSLGYITAKMEEKEPLRFESPIYDEEFIEVNE